MEKKLIEDLNGLGNELAESYRIMSVVRRLELKLKILMETKSDEVTTRT